MIEAQKKNKELAPLFTDKKDKINEIAQKTTTSIPTGTTQGKVNVAPQKENSPRENSPKNMASFGVSLKSLSAKDETQSTKKDTYTIDISLQNPYTLQQLQSAWIEYTNSIDFDRHYKSALVNSAPQSVENNTFEILTDNQLQAEKLDGEKVKVLNFLRRRLKNASINMTIRVDVNNEQRIAFTSIDKYKLMVEENENLKLLKERLNLELM